MTEEEVRRWLSQGAAAAQAGDRAQAEPLLLRYVQADPGNAEAWLWLGWVAGTPAEALARIQRAATLAPDDARVQKALAWAQS
ncbi:MAG: hypothetical protein KKB13_07725, partial [Chloroflexi bacterium]|nr:hypothetical protein [Chloroflexota bacterium]